VLGLWLLLLPAWGSTTAGLAPQHNPYLDTETGPLTRSHTPPLATTPKSISGCAETLLPKCLQYSDTCIVCQSFVPPPSSGLWRRNLVSLASQLGHARRAAMPGRPLPASEHGPPGTRSDVRLSRKDCLPLTASSPALSSSSGSSDDDEGPHPQALPLQGSSSSLDNQHHHQEPQQLPQQPSSFLQPLSASSSASSSALFTASIPPALSAPLSEHQHSPQPNHTPVPRSPPAADPDSFWDIGPPGFEATM